MSHLRTHTVEVGETRRTTWDGRDHLVVPVVMIVEGVLNGELVTQEAMSDAAMPDGSNNWDGRPVVINHPTERGVHVSANTPAQLEQAIGTIFNTHLDGNKLKAEMWIEVEAAPEIVEAFETGHVMEVSTGYFAGTIPEEGTFNGQIYSGVQTGIRPDHLAILPHDIGACSIEDGCGAPRVNSERTVPNVSTHKSKRNPMAGLMTFMRRAFTRNAEDASFNEIWNALSNALGYDAWVMDFYDGTVVYELWTGGDGYQLYQRTYTIDETTLEVTFTGEPEPVAQRVDYVPTEGEADAEVEPVVNSKPTVLGNLHVEITPSVTAKPVANGLSGKGNGVWVGHPDHPTLAVKAESKDCGCTKTNSGKKVSMKKNRSERLARIKAREATKEDIIDELVEGTNTEVVEADREALEALPQETLENLLPADVLEEIEEEAEAEEAAAPVANLDDYVNGIPDADAREFIMDGIHAQRQRRAELTNSLIANKANEFTREELAGMSTNQLERLSNMLTPEVSYAGRAVPRTNSFVEEPLTTMSTHRKEVN